MTRSRRSILAAVGASIAALGGCSRLDRGSDAPKYDPERLAALGDRSVPRPPATFPVTIPDAMRARHRKRARRLLDRVPSTPDVPNGAVAGRLRRKRSEVVEELDDAGAERDELPEGPLERLDEARHVREDAAAVEAAYRASTGDVTVQAVAERRSTLRSAVLGFERDWTYLGDDPATAVVMHRVLEDLVRDVRDGVTPEQAFPVPPAADPFQVGEVVRHLESGHAALADARRLRTRYRETLTEPRPFRTDVSVAAARTRRRARFREADVHEYVDADARNLPFERSIEGTALERLYRATTASVERNRTDVERARWQEGPATALVEAGIDLASLRTLDAVVTAIRDGRVEAPTRAADVAAARREAVERLSVAWSAKPTVIAVELAEPAYRFLRRGTAILGNRFGDDEPPDAGDADRAFVNFVRGARYAEAIPPTVADLRETFADLTADGG